MSKEPGSLCDDLVFDVGLHKGEDSAYYLALGYSVVGFEANPELVELNLHRFATEIESGQMTVVHGAVGYGEDLGSSVVFYQHPTKSVWGTTQPDWVERNSARGNSIRTEVPTVDFAKAISTYGMPLYMKIDVEGVDRQLLDATKRFNQKPRYLSIESEKRLWSSLIAEFDALEELGYNRFSIRQQEGRHRSRRLHHTTDRYGNPLKYRFEEDSSGPFGEDIDRWVTRAEAEESYRKIFRRYRLLGDDSLMQRTKPGFLLLKGLSRIIRRPLPGWYDTHASHSDTIGK